MDRVRLIGGDHPGHHGRAAARPAANPARQAAAQRRPTVPLMLQEAIIARHVLLLDYRDRNEVVTTREVEPVAFAGLADHWYLVAWCRLRQGARAFRLDRILAAADTGQPAPERSFSDLEVDIPDALVRRVELAG